MTRADPVLPDYPGRVVKKAAGAAWVAARACEGVAFVVAWPWTFRMPGLPSCDGCAMTPALSRRIDAIRGDGSDGWDIHYRSRAMVEAGETVLRLTVGEHRKPRRIGL